MSQPLLGPPPGPGTQNRKWQKLSPAEFKQLQEYASYSSKELKDILGEFKNGGALSMYDNSDEVIGYEGFQKFLNLYLDAEVPEELTSHLFASFVKRPSSSPQVQAQLSPTSVKESFNLPIDRAVVPGAISATGVRMLAPATPTGVIPPSTSFESKSTLGRAREKIRDKVETLLQIPGLQHGGGSQHALHISESECNLGPSSSKSLQPSPVAPLPPTRPGSEWKSGSSSPNSLPSRNSSRKSNQSSLKGTGVDEVRAVKVLSPVPSACEDSIEMEKAEIPLKDIVCYLSLLEAGSPEDKLEFVFRLYDSDGNGYLDSSEMESIIEQMMSVARYLEWDTIELEPILREMMREIDYDSDGTVSLDEWKRGGITTIPLLVLLGFDTDMKEDGTHIWRLRHFNRQAYCNICYQRLVALGGRQGLSCTLCKYTVHERCAKAAQKNCISTYIKSKSEGMKHHWVEGNCTQHCRKCRKNVKMFEGKHCRWCQTTLHNRCSSHWKEECTLGKLATHILPPTAICPSVLHDRGGSQMQRTLSMGGTPRKESTMGTQPTSFQITPPPSTRPLLVFINPKSGGKQGDKLYRKFQYLLNPRQVYNLSQGGPAEGLRMFMDVENVNILCCGGDGTVGWILDAMGNDPTLTGLFFLLAPEYVDQKFQ